jgi:hypothetical protein
MANREVRTLIQRLSLRSPQATSLEILAEVLDTISLEKGGDPAAALDLIRALHPSVTNFEREFPSLCFALATGVGKTRLMGAFIAYLYLTGKSRNFFVLAPNKTIYDKLIGDFSPESPKYVFRGIAEFVENQPSIITVENYKSGIGIRLEGGRSSTLFGGDIHVNIFNIDIINKEEGPRELLQLSLQARRPSFADGRGAPLPRQRGCQGDQRLESDPWFGTDGDAQDRWQQFRRLLQCHLSLQSGRGDGRRLCQGTRRCHPEGL